MDAFYNQVLSAPGKIALIGSGCSVATEPTAENSHYYNITHVRKYCLSAVYSQYKTCAVNIHLQVYHLPIQIALPSLYLTLPPFCADLLCLLLHRIGKQGEVSLLFSAAAD